MTLSTAVFGSESPNDRISTILAVMTSISERVDKLVGKVSKMEGRMDSMDTKMDKVDQDVKTNGWRYLGRGYLQNFWDYTFTMLSDMRRQTFC